MIRQGLICHLFEDKFKVRVDLSVALLALIISQFFHWVFPGDFYALSGNKSLKSAFGSKKSSKLSRIQTNYVHDSGV